MFKKIRKKEKENASKCINSVQGDSISKYPVLVIQIKSTLLTYS